MSQKNKQRDESGSIGARELGRFATVKISRVEDYYVDVYVPHGTDIEEKASEAIGHGEKVMNGKLFTPK